MSENDSKSMPRPLLILHTVEQVDILHHQQPDRLATADILALTPDVWGRLGQLGYPARTVADTVSIEDLDAIRARAAALDGDFLAEHLSGFDIDGLNVFALERYNLYYLFLTGLLASSYFARVIQDSDVPSITAFAIDPATLDPVRPSITVFIAVIHYLAEQHGIPYETLALPVQQGSGPRHGNLVQRLASSRLQKLSRTLNGIVTNPLVWQTVKRCLGLARPRRIFGVFLISEAGRFAEITQRLQTHFGADFYPAVCGATTLGGTTVEEYKLHYASLSLFVTPAYLRLRRDTRQLYANWRRFQSSYNGEYPELFANPHLDDLFSTLFRKTVPNTIQTYRDALAIFRAFRSRLLLTGSIPASSLPGVIQAARQLAIPVLTIPHSGLVGEINAQLRGTHKIAWTADEAAAWDAQTNEESIITGLPDSIVLQGYSVQDTWQPRDPARKTIVILVASIQAGAFFYVDFNRYTAALRALLTVPASLVEQVTLVLKLHPQHDYIAYYDRLIAEAGAADQVEIVRAAPLGGLLLQADLVMAMTATSAYLLPLAQGIPELCVAVGGTLAESYGFPRWGGSAVIQDTEAIWTRVEEVLFDPAARAALLADNRRYWERINGTQTDPIGQMISAVEELVISGHSRQLEN